MTPLLPPLLLTTLFTLRVLAQTTGGLNLAVTSSHSGSGNGVTLGTNITIHWEGTSSSNSSTPISLALVTGPRENFSSLEAEFVVWLASGLSTNTTYNWNTTLDPFTSQPVNTPPSLPDISIAPNDAPKKLLGNTPYSWALTDGIDTLVGGFSFEIDVNGTSNPNPSETANPSSGTGTATTSTSTPSKTGGAMMENRPFSMGMQMGIGAGVVGVCGLFL